MSILKTIIIGIVAIILAYIVINLIFWLFGLAWFIVKVVVALLIALPIFFFIKSKF